MRLTRVHVPARLAPGATHRLPDAAGTHLVRVLRLGPGDALAVFDGGGREHEAVVASVRGTQVEVRVGAAREPAAESPLAITLVQGVSRGERMDYAIQKATELGVACIRPVLTERSVVRLDAAQAARRVEHWRGVAASAAGQCGRAVIPAIEPPARYADWLATLAATPADGECRLLLAPDAGRGLADLPQPLARVDLLIGPEGGLSDAEAALARSRGYAGLRLGPRVLRTETAAAAAIAALQVLRGDLG